MDAKKIIERINNPAELQNDVANEWKKLTEKHPYFSVGQLLQFGNDYFQEKENIAFTAIYKSDPIQFAQFVNELKSAEKIDLKKSKQENTILDKALVIEKAEINSKEPLAENMTVEAVSILPTEETITTSVLTAEMVKDEIPVEHNKSTIAPQEDILALINQLPNSNIIEEKMTRSEPIIEIVDSVAFTEEEKRQKSLMVMMSFNDWLNHFKSKTENEQIEEQEKRALKTAWQKEKLTAVIEEEQDEIPEKIFKQAMDSISMENALISESLAVILAKQGKTDKAIEMYKKLSLRNPEKNSYFADRIKDLLTNNI
jgi:tetratricopeptide (TPR) repeat protein